MIVDPFSPEGDRLWEEVLEVIRAQGVDPDEVMRRGAATLEAAERGELPYEEPVDDP